MEQISEFLKLMFYLIMSGGLLGLLAIVWTASARFTKLETTVELVVTNHLPHIFERLGNIEEAINGRNQISNTRGN